MTPEDNFLQVCYLNLQKGMSVQPHLHLKNIKKTTKSSEAWILISGSIAIGNRIVKCELFILRKVLGIQNSF